MRRLSIVSLALALSVAPLWGANVPRKAPEFVVLVPGGSNIVLSEYKGKILILEFMLTTCPHCQRASATINKVLQEYAPRGVRAVGVAINAGADLLVPAYVQQLGLTYPVGYTANHLARQFLQHPPMLSMMMPQLVLIDRQGIIRAQYSGTDKFFQDEEKNLRAKLEELLKAGGNAKGSSVLRRKAAAKKPT